MRFNKLLFLSTSVLLSLAVGPTLCGAQQVDMPKLMQDLAALNFTPAGQAHGQTRAQLATRKTGCVEDLMPRKDGAYYQDQVQILKITADRNSEDYQNAWTYIKAAEHSAEKINEIYAASEKYNIPPMILFGSLAQESSLQEMGLAKDYFNWACGVGQLNINYWCGWANQADAQTQREIGWPRQEVDHFHAQNPRFSVCGTFFIVPEFIRPFHQAAMSQMQAELGAQAPEYMLEERHVLSGRPVSFADSYPMLQTMAQYYFPNNALAASAEAQNLRYKMAQNFVTHCSEHRYGIDAAAFTFKKTFDALPAEIRNAQAYQPTELRLPICKSTIKSDHFPISIGWLLADAIYNAGPELLPGVMTYQRQSGISWENFSPENLVDAINYTLKLPNNGLKPIGLKEAIGHVTGVLEAIGAVERINENN